MPRKLIPDSLYSQIFHQAYSARVILDEKGQIMLGNEKFLELSGWSQNEAIKHNFNDLLPKWEQRDPLPDQGVLVLQTTGGERHFHFCCKALDTIRKRYYTVHLQSFEEGQEDLVHQLEEDSQEQHRQNQAKSAFLANISHEIRTPMNGIMGMTDLVMQTELQEDQKEYINIIKISAESLLRILNDILDFSKMESGKMTLEEIRFSIEDLINELCHFFKPQMENRRLEMHCEVDPAIPKHFWGDPLRIKQILMNLMSNALKFTSQGGVELRIQGNRETQGRWKLVFSVIDTGIGIPAEKQDLLFKSFSQVDLSTSRIYGGTGLGLAICSSLCTQMGGDISVESREGEGSTFRVEIPLTQAVQPSIEESHKEEFPWEERLEGLKILVVEDNRVNRLLACKLLQKRKIQVIEAEDGQHGLSQYKDNRPDLILMDIHMPEWDGYRTLREIRSYEEQHSLEQVPILALTAMAMKGDQDAILDRGFQGYISKPFNPDDLFAKIYTSLYSQVDKELA